MVGAGRAAELVLSARMVEAAEAERIGLFERVFPEDAFEDEVRKVAREYASRAPLALAAAKRTLARSWDVELEATMAAEREAQLACFGSADAREGIAAFHEKRRPAFRGE
jgi:enoyl-CoA hydratase/carnithine racemase